MGSERRVCPLIVAPHSSSCNYVHSNPRLCSMSCKVPVAEPTIQKIPTATDNVAAAAAITHGKFGEWHRSAERELTKPQKKPVAPIMTVAAAQKLKMYEMDDARPGISRDGNTPNTPPGPPTPWTIPTPSAAIASYECEPKQLQRRAVLAFDLPPLGC
mmetsp:Transcript_28046/g.85682  ORF Transcript_28046/g.85682 Transcript_28046/m.85682 type:complete len:158 (+) Transcript_28046:345-818(+)|eukprot:scaffold139403_cov38-Tisochrysis_lutea.AAC.2